MSYKLLQAAARVKGLTPHERCVLITLADRANHKTMRCWPGVATMANDTGVSEREVHRALKRLRSLGMITVSGKTKYGTNVYLLQLKEGSEQTVPHTDDEAMGSAISAQLAVSQCHTGSLSVPVWQTNKGSEPITEQIKPQIQTSTIKPVLACAPVTNSKTEPGKASESTDNKEKEDSKLVQAWKSAHKKIGLKCYVNATDGKKLSLLVKGENGIAYHDAIQTLIPRAVADWKVMCIYLTQKYGVSLWGKNPVPKWPHAGFLLTHRNGALEFCMQTPEHRVTVMNLYVNPFLKKLEKAESFDAEWD
jgi:DNA-binding transcriptional regulator YhcF (GntR family)